MDSTKGLDKLNTEKNEIRLLCIHPHQDDEAQVECSRSTVSLDSNPQYEALSYAWGDPTAVESIVLDGQIADVPRSSWSALKALRHKDRRRILWIDAVCINQDDLVERAAQVNLMGMVYRKAESVRVWLGSDDGRSDDAILVLKSLTSAENLKALLGYDDDAKRNMETLKHFFAKSWWERLWVVQEVSLGRHVVFQLGSGELSYDELLSSYLTADAYFRETLNGFNYGVFGGGPWDFMERFKSVKVLSQCRELCGNELRNEEKTQVRKSLMTWTTVANLVRDRKASVDKDRLYSLYGLLPASVSRLPGLKPSYSATTEDVFTDVTYNIMEASQSLMMFSYLQDRESNTTPQLPSWVPDWRGPPTNHHESNLRVGREEIFDASAGKPFYLQRLGPKTICLKGFFVDAVQTWQGAPLAVTASPMLDGCYKAWRERWANTLPDNAMLKTYLDGSDAETVFRRTMIWDCSPGQQDGTVKRLTQDEGLAMWNAHERAVKIAFGDDYDIMGEKLSDADARRAEYMMKCAHSRAFFVTFSQLVGMTQTNVEAGDHIFIVAGSSHPIILRPSKTYANTWQAVGECYLHGFMYGAGVNNIEICAKFEEYLLADPVFQKMKATEENPRWNELSAQPQDGLWKWLVIE